MLTKLKTKPISSFLDPSLWELESFKIKSCRFSHSAPRGRMLNQLKQVGNLAYLNRLNTVAG